MTRSVKPARHSDPHHALTAAIARLEQGRHEIALALVDGLMCSLVQPGRAEKLRERPPTPRYPPRDERGAPLPTRLTRSELAASRSPSTTATRTASMVHAGRREEPLSTLARSGARDSTSALHPEPLLGIRLVVRGLVGRVGLATQVLVVSVHGLEVAGRVESPDQPGGPALGECAARHIAVGARQAASWKPVSADPHLVL